MLPNNGKDPSVGQREVLDLRVIFELTFVAVVFLDVVNRIL